mmetsp:Transcript_75940/g.245930  ORF Transcript_75940/g.245930 Transcript_75940/m.245930 type:complete len:335 (+) Transcript_75940:1854-2858(+)
MRARGQPASTAHGQGRAHLRAAQPHAGPSIAGGTAADWRGLPQRPCVGEPCGRAGQGVPDRFCCHAAPLGLQCVPPRAGEVASNNAIGRPRFHRHAAAIHLGRRPPWRAGSRGPSGAGAGAGPFRRRRHLAGARELHVAGLRLYAFVPAAWDARGPGGRWPALASHAAHPALALRARRGRPGRRAHSRGRGGAAASRGCHAAHGLTAAAGGLREASAALAPSRPRGGGHPDSRPRAPANWRLWPLAARLRFPLAGLRARQHGHTTAAQPAAPNAWRCVPPGLARTRRRVAAVLGEDHGAVFGPCAREDELVRADAHAVLAEALLRAPAGPRACA